MDANRDLSAKTETALAAALATGSVNDEDAQVLQDLHFDLTRKACVTVMGPVESDIDALVELLLGEAIPCLSVMPRDLVITYAARPNVQLFDATGSKSKPRWDAVKKQTDPDPCQVYAELGLPLAALKNVTLVRSVTPDVPSKIPDAVEWLADFTDFAIYAAPAWSTETMVFWSRLPAPIMDRALHVHLGDQDDPVRPGPELFKTSLWVDLAAATAARLRPDPDLPALKASGAAGMIAHIRQSVDRARQQVTDQALMVLDRLEKDGVLAPPNLQSKPKAKQRQAKRKDVAISPPPWITECPIAVADPPKPLSSLADAITVLVEAGEMMQTTLEPGQEAMQIEIARTAIAALVVHLEALPEHPGLLPMANAASSLLESFDGEPDAYDVMESVSVLLQIKRQMQAELAPAPKETSDIVARLRENDLGRKLEIVESAR